MNTEIPNTRLTFHVMNRCNNHEWFKVSKDECWKIFRYCLREHMQKYDIEIHAVTLMSNHYHAILTSKSRKELGQFMCRFQWQFSVFLNKISNRSDHVFGKRYKACLIDNPVYYAYCYRYVIQNPLRAQDTTDVRNYKYCSFYEQQNQTSFGSLVTPAPDYLQLLVPEGDEMIKWLNINLTSEEMDGIRSGLKKKKFDPSVTKRKRRHAIADAAMPYEKTAATIRT